jgi:COP9 signalosome complex subunit 1
MVDSASVAHIEEVAVYAGLTALASYSRGQLTRLSTDAQARAVIEYSPGLKDAISGFTSSTYSVVLSNLNALKVCMHRDLGGHSLHPRLAAHWVPCRCKNMLECSQKDFQHDMYLAPEVNDLIALVRDSAMTHYVSPFSRVLLPEMAAAFSLS